MTKKIIVVATTFLLLLGATAFWNAQETKKQEQKEQATKQAEQQSKNEQAQNQGQMEGIDTSGWQTYRSEEYGFEVKCPKDWKVMNLANNARGIGFSKDSQSHIFSVVYYESFDDLNWKSPRSERNIENYLKQSENMGEIKKIDFNGAEAFSSVFENKKINYKEVDIFVEHKNHIYKLSFPNTEKLNNERMLILSSFLFI